MRVDVNGKSYEVALNESGLVETVAAGERVSAPSMAALRKKLKQLHSMSAEAVYAWEQSSWERDQDELRTERVVVTGTHGRNGNYLVKSLEDDKTFQLYKQTNDLLRPDVDVEKLKRLWKEKQAAWDSYTQFVQDNQLELWLDQEKAE